MSGICPVLVRYMSAFLPDIYRTYREHIADNDRREIGATQELLYGLDGESYKIRLRVAFQALV